MRFRLAFFIVAFLAPLIAFTIIIDSYAQRREENESRILNNFADTAAQQLQYSANNSRFWCNELGRIFSAATDSRELNRRISSLGEHHRQKMSWIIWDKEGNTRFSNIVSKRSEKTWQRVAGILRKGIATWWPRFSEDDDIFIRSVLGLQFESRALQRMVFRNQAILSKLSQTSPAGNLWADFNEEHGIMVLFPDGIERKKQGLRHCINVFANKSMDFAVYRSDFFHSSDNSLSLSQIIELRNDFRLIAPQIMKNGKKIITARYVDENLFFCASKKQEFSTAVLKSKMLFALALAFLWLLVLLEVKRGGIKNDFSIKYVVAALITCANIFPLLIMGILGQQYLEQKREILIEERRIEALNFLNRIVIEFIADTQKIKDFALSSVRKLCPVLQKEKLSEKNTRPFRKEMKSVASRFMIIASATYPTVSNIAFLDTDQTILINADGQLPNLPYDQQSYRFLNDAFNKCGAAFISLYNNTALPGKTFAQAELIAESYFQTSINAVCHDFLRLLDQVENLGFGQKTNPTFMHFLSLFSENMADYLFIFHLLKEIHAGDFLHSLTSVLQRNIHGIKVIYALGNSLKNLTIEPFSENHELRNLFARLTYFPQPSPELIDLAGETWIATGFVSRVIGDTCLIALAPVRSIDKQLSTEKADMLWIIFINILLVAGISLVFIQTLLRPVADLQAAAQAIMRRDFSFRISSHGKDEFGRMSSVFDNAIHDLEEMSIARKVQQQLFPQKSFSTGDFDLYCKTITMADLGGDYLDVFAMDEERFVVILGDVAGHGVGAAMIMAMAKAAMLNSIDILDQPSKLLPRLHQLIYRTKTRKQKKIMTFQYLLVDSHTHKVIYANAGGCNPFLIREKTKIPEEIKLPGAALGSFKNSRFTEIEIKLEPGDTLVFYTDGLVESRNDAGEEMGFSRFAQTLGENVCIGSQDFYNAIITANKAWRQNQPRQDDYSLMLLQRKS